ncbi:MAG: hypothetical protein KDN22_33430 [Verrucomicrobiae bacterium]|nr:hypothetical protein [Verrucomicrobiae bacterium]
MNIKNSTILFCGLAVAILVIWLQRGDDSSSVVERSLEELLATGHVRSALELAENKRGTDEFAICINQIVTLGTQDDWRSVFDWIKTVIEPSQQSDLILKMVDVLGEIDPAGGIKLVDLLFSDPALQLNAIVRLVETWGHKSPGQAMRWLVLSMEVNKFDEEQLLQTSDVMRLLIEAWAEEAPMEVTTWLQGLDPAMKLTAAVWNSALSLLIVRDPGTATNLLTALPLAKLGTKSRRIAMEGGSWAHVDPEAALSHFRDGDYETVETVRYQNSIFLKWAISDPVNAAERISKDMNNTDINNIDMMMSVGYVASEYLKVDPLDASKWVVSLPYGRNRDGAISQIIVSTLKSDPDAAFEWATLLSSEEKMRAKNRMFYLHESVRQLHGKGYSREMLADKIGDAHLNTDEIEGLIETIAAITVGESTE